MVSTKKLACPFCDVRLRVADTLPVGKMITCPKCGEGFPVPEENGPPPAPKTAAASSTYAFPQQAEAAKVKRVRKVVPAPDEDEGSDEEVEERPKPRKRRKQAKEPTSNTPLVWGLILGGGVPLLIAVVLAGIFRPWQKKAEAVVVNAPGRPVAAEPGPSRPEPVARRPGPAGTGSGAEPVSSGQAAAGAGSDRIAAGQGVYQANNCGRCHALGGGSGAGRRPRGPDLSKTGAEHTVEWLMEQVRDPHSHKPDSRMPSYGDKISEDDLRALATYLASLK